MYGYMHDPMLQVSAVGIVAFLVALFIAAIFLWLAGKLIGIEKASIGRSMVAILGGGILAAIVMALTALVLAPLAPFLGFLANLWAVKVVFDTGWIKAFLAWLLAAIIAGIVMGILAFLGLFTLGALSTL
ncbi:hypothetical protein [Thermococcus sp.]|uniref:hypothetical protein n=1 Tax=Thermococcus sp. TaxID=35749 RepID=UPI002635FB20|nr:hypothetical protein [Thermococcus sp.]